MPRPIKCRRVCHHPETLEFTPSGSRYSGETIVLSIDEYETIRLIDKENLSQEECAAQLGIGRTTAQKIYENARKKLAEALVLGLPLKINGGDIRVCQGNETNCPRHNCFRQQFKLNYNTEKGDNIMRIAVTYENGEIFQHFGHTNQFKIYDVNDGAVITEKVFDTLGQGHGALAGFLSALNVDILICGGIGGGAQMALADANIKLYGGASGNADEAVKALLAGELSYNPDVKCNHHNHEHGEGHTCGDHGCGKNSCRNN